MLSVKDYVQFIYRLSIALWVSQIVATILLPDFVDLYVNN